jgi:hypothetical protein
MVSYYKARKHQSMKALLSSWPGPMFSDMALFTICEMTCSGCQSSIPNLNIILDLKTKHTILNEQAAKHRMVRWICGGQGWVELDMQM